MKCAACGDPAVGVGPGNKACCKGCTRLIRIKRVRWLTPANPFELGYDVEGEGENRSMWPTDRSGRQIFEDACVELARIERRA